MKKSNVFVRLALCGVFFFQSNAFAAQQGSQANNWYTPESLKATVQEGMDVAEGLKTAAQRRIDAAVVAAKEGIAYGMGVPGRLKTSVESAITYGLDIPSNIIKEINSFIIEAAKNSESKKQKILTLFNDYTNMPELTKTTLSEELEGRIDEILHLKYIDSKNNESVFLFPTPKSRIFVLKNIQDFFEFQTEYKDLNAKVYEMCTKMMHKLEGEAASKSKPNSVSASIDSYRDAYMKQYNISVATLSLMSDAELDEKIKSIELEIKNLIRSKQESVGEWSRKDSPEFRALLSILTHLSFKKSNKERPMFVGVDAQQELRKSQADYAKKIQGIAASVAAHRAAQAAHEAAQSRGLGYQDKMLEWMDKYPGLKFQSLEQAQQAQKQKAAQQQAEQSVEKQSWWSTIKSWFSR